MNAAELIVLGVCAFWLLVGAVVIVVILLAPEEDAL